MTPTEQKYNGVFCSVFEVNQSAAKDLSYQGIDEWDSVGHMGLMGELEDSFEITLEMEDIIDFSSYAEGKKILAKYGVDFNE